MHEHPSSSVSADDSAVTSIDVTVRLRQAIAADHLAIEELPMSLALLDGTVCTAAYLTLLQELAPIHAAIEARVDAEASLRHIFEGPLIRRHAPLTADLARWGAPPAHPSQTAVHLAAWVYRCHDGEAVGACYVVAGSCLGAAVLAPRLARTFGVPCAPGTGLDYQFIAPHILGAAWRVTKERLAAWGSTSERDDAACAGARAMMRGLRDVYGGCAP